MKVITEGLKKSGGYTTLLSAVESRRLPAVVTGLGHIHKAMYTSSILEQTGRYGVVLTRDESEALKLTEDLMALGISAAFYPTKEISLLPLQYGSREFEQQRLQVLAKLLNKEITCVVMSVEAATQYVMPPEVLQNHTLTIAIGKTLPVDDLPGVLVTAGYERCTQVEGPGQFAVRGGIWDIFPAASSYPIRFELWGDQVDTLAAFDLLSQRRTEELESVQITPATERIVENAGVLADKIVALAETLKSRSAAFKEYLLSEAAKIADGLISASDVYFALLYDRPGTIFEYLDNPLIWLSEAYGFKEKIHNASWQLEQDAMSEMEANRFGKQLLRHTMSWTDLARYLQDTGCVLMDTFARTEPDFRLRELISVQARQLPVWSGNQSVLQEDLADFTARKMMVLVLTGANSEIAKDLASSLTEEGIPAMYSPNPSEVNSRFVTVSCGTISAGAEFTDANIAIVTHGKIQGQKQGRRVRKNKGGLDLHSLSELKKGDYVVHATHGVAIFEGVQKVEIEDVQKDYLKLQYAKGAVLYVPVTQLDLVSKYMGVGDDGKIKLNSLGGQDWNRTKSRVRSAVRDIAADLIKLYSERMQSKGFAFSSDQEWQYDFERKFEYEETEDQLRCTEEIKQDMERPVPMDRLLCGDVGFGKTEVALRAAFKCISEGKQCAILVPTTILALQHYQTILSRFEGFPVTVEMLSRFRKPKEQSNILKKLKTGEVDIIVGTHRLLAQNIEFRDLGLFIIDEEQRFGVEQKEKLKQLTPNVDVLTLSATPIPRTLNMAMSGIRDMSIIEEAPQDRHPVQTYVLEHDLNILEDAMRRELRRGGQVYYLYNRVDGIAHVARQIQEKIPEARIAYAHGKMSEEELSDIWRQVMEQEIDILVCTTIIETGVDIPNVNTLIIEDADRFGLSQLHQIRGRVGRSSRRAFAYLTFHRGKELSETATKRLEAMREFTEFGSGFRIAMRDMEIRGVGNLLGAQQHGHMEAVGYDLYIKMLEDAVSEQKGVRNVKREDECLVDLPISAHIPSDYIEDMAARMEIYRRIADIRTMEDSVDVYDELIDRFGEPPEEVQGLVEVALLRNMAAELGIYEIKESPDAILLYTRELNTDLGMKMTKAMYGRVLISATSKPYIAVKGKPGMTQLDVLREALEAGQKKEDDSNESGE